MIMNDKHMLDPDDPTGARDVRDGLLEAVSPVALSPERADALKQRLLARVRASRAAGADFIHVRLDEGEWGRLVPGVRVKRLCGDARSVLLELQPGAAIPFHRHHADEECVVLRGEAQLGDITVRVGDYHLARSGSRHGVVRSSGGALLYLRGTPIGHGMEVARDVISALLPGRGQAPITVHRDEGEWTERQPGVRLKLLHDDGHERSLLLSLAPGAHADFRDPPLDRECLVIEGEAFAGDRLLRTGDYQFAPDGVRQPPFSSDVGSLLFVRSVSRPAA